MYNDLGSVTLPPQHVAGRYKPTYCTSLHTEHNHAYLIGSVPVGNLVTFQYLRVCASQQYKPKLRRVH
jgi:hypothetical protein